MAITNDELLEDLKQFINTKVDGVETSLGKRLDTLEEDVQELKIDVQELKEEVQEVKIIQNEILDAVGQDIQEVKTVQQKNDIRITKLEAKAA